MSFVVAIDGPAGTGKGTITGLISKEMGLVNIDTGATYRCVALYAIRNNIKLEETEKIIASLEDIQIDMKIFYIFATLIVFFGAIIPMDAAWAMADITMGLMTLINLPTCVAMGKTAIDCLKDYEYQKKLGQVPVFKASSIGLEDEDNFWN